MTTPREWRFIQLGGDRKEFELTGKIAPHGRPRQSPIVKSGIELRDAEVHYPGNRDKPTRHVFGVRYPDWELKGRFEDSALGAGGARAKMRELEQFVADAQSVSIRWGEYLHYTGIARKAHADYESDAHVAWTLVFGIDRNEDLERPIGERALTSGAAFADRTAELLARLDAMKGLATPPDVLQDQLSVSFLDQLDSLVANLNAFSASILAVSEQIGSFEEALAGDVLRFQAGLHQIQTAALSILETMAAAEQDAILIRQNATTEAAWASYRLQADVDAAFMLAVIADLNRDADIALRGQATTSYQAQAGDTWESISMRAFGAPDRANDLRQANGATFGDTPQPGRTYRIPA